MHHFVFVCLRHIDFFGSNVHWVYDTKIFVNNFDVKDLSGNEVILGINVTSSKGIIALTQSQHIENQLKKFNYFDVSPLSTSLDPGVSLKKNKGVNVKYKFSQITGFLMHLMNHRRPNIAFAVDIFEQIHS